MQRIQNFSRKLLWGVDILLFALPLSALFIWALIDTRFMARLLAEGVLFDPIFTPEGLVDLTNISWTLGGRAILLIGFLVGLLPLFLGLLSLRNIFLRYRAGSIFTTENARQYRRLGILFLLDAIVAKPLSQMFIALATTLSNPPGHRYLLLRFGTLNLEEVVCALFVIVISWVMLEGSKIEEERQLTV